MINCSYVPIPLGFVGPLLLDGSEIFVPLATTEGALVASTNRGCRAITESGGATSSLFNEGMTRAPVLQMASSENAVRLKTWVEEADNFAKCKAVFESTTRFGKLQNISSSIAGRHVHLRFKCTTGDAMGMNMVSKGCLEVIQFLEKKFPDVQMLSLSGNMVGRFG